MSRDLSLSREQAVKRLKTERWAAGTVARLRTELGEDYGGNWLGADGATLTVAVADPGAGGDGASRRARCRSRSTGASASWTR